MTSQDTLSLLTYRFLKGIGKKYLTELAITAEATNQTVQDCFISGKFGTHSYTESELNFAHTQAQEQINIAESLGHRVISRLDKEYPESLKSISDSPPILFCFGNISLLHKDIITIIGTREPTKHGESIATRITHWFSEKKWVIASGLAKGVDTIAHSSCLDVKGETISILAHGLEKIYPAQNKNLANDIISSNGLIISEYNYNSYIGKSNFVERDRIQAALAKAVVLIQSDLIGGSLHASRAILEYERYLVVAGQSNKDIFNKENKISANLLLLNGNQHEKIKLLKTTEDYLGKLLLLHNKDFLEEINLKIKDVSFTNKQKTAGNNIKLF